MRAEASFPGLEVVAAVSWLRIGVHRVRRRTRGICMTGNFQSTVQMQSKVSEVAPREYHPCLADIG